MSTPKTTIAFFCHAKSDNSPRPGQPSVAVIQLVAQQKAHLAANAPDLNAGLFADNGSGVLSLSGASDEIYARFKSGKSYTVTIEETP